MYDIIFNGSCARDHGAAVVQRPDMPGPVPRAQSYDIAGRDGALLEFDGTYEDITIEIQMNFLSSPDRWMGRWQGIKHWLYSEGDGRLIFSDCPDIFHKVKNVSIETAERTLWRIGSFTVSFTCDPYAYLGSGAVAIPSEDALLNPGCLCHPVYQITGNGRCTLTVNGKEMSAEVGQNLTIDTERMIAYREDGTLMNTTITGDYEQLYLKPGMNQISVTEGFTLMVIPNWRTL